MSNEVETVFADYEKIIFHKLQEIKDKKQGVLYLKTKVKVHEEHNRDLKEYVRNLETLLRKASKIELTNLSGSIEELQNAIKNVKKDIADLEMKKNDENQTTELTKQLVMSQKEEFSELSIHAMDILLRKEKKLLELKHQTNTESSYGLKEKQELEVLKKEHDMLKAKNIHLKEMVHKMGLKL